ncbi:unnamed protein product [Polarella glacialis]|uniref:Uncharacterized protein n=1 Tax=Polarella glacialis TaxID=89957 RepID=A0A813LP07_POLGL|nr:unnamed protein product [Polarella glacialis]
MFVFAGTALSLIRRSWMSIYAGTSTLLPDVNPTPVDVCFWWNCADLKKTFTLLPEHEGLLLTKTSDHKAWACLGRFQDLRLTQTSNNQTPNTQNTSTNTNNNTQTTTTTNNNNHHSNNNETTTTTTTTMKHTSAVNLSASYVQLESW